MNGFFETEVDLHDVRSVPDCPRLVVQRSPFMLRRRMPGLLTEAGGLYPHALQEAGKLGGSFELRYRVELLERRREGVREAPQCARFEL
jgi:hypothetical protein